MKKNLLILTIGFTLGAALIGCNNSSDKFIGKWQDPTESASSFTIIKTDKGIELQSSGESSTIRVDVDGNKLMVDGTTLTLDEQGNELSMPGLFNSKIIFKKINTEQK